MTGNAHTASGFCETTRVSPREAAIIDPYGLWTSPLSSLESLCGSVKWSLSTALTPPATADLSVLITTTLDDRKRLGPRALPILTVLVDCAVPIGLEDIGALLVCDRRSMSSNVNNAINALFTLVMANHCVRYCWEDVVAFISRDALVVSGSTSSRSRDAIAGEAAATLGYHQGATRIEPTAFITSIRTSETLPLREVADVRQVLRTLCSHACAFDLACHSADELSAATYFLAAFAIPTLPGTNRRTRKPWHRQ